MTNKIRNVTKQLLGAEDVLFGRGIVSQRRGTVDVPVHRLDLALPVADEAELAVTDPEQYPKASIGSRNFVAVNGQYQEVSTIQPVLFSVGAMMSAEYPYAIDGDTVAKWTGAFPKTLTLADQGFTNPGWLVTSTGLGRAIISETVPSASFTREGVRWYKPSESTTYVYYCDGDSCQWVQEPVQSAEGTLRQEIAAPDSDVPVGGVASAKLNKRVTVAQLAATAFPIGSQLTVTDRDNATFEVVPSATVNGFGVLPVGGGRAAILRLPASEVNVKWLGAIGDAVFDNSAVLQHALDYYYNVYIPKGNYLHSTGLLGRTAQKVYSDYSNNQSLADTSFLIYTGTGTAFSVAAPSGFYYGNYLENITLVASGSAINTATGLLLKNLSETRVFGINSIGFAKAVVFDNVNICECDYIVTSNCPVGLEFSGFTSAHVELRNINIWNCSIAAVDIRTSLNQVYFKQPWLENFLYGFRVFVASGGGQLGLRLFIENPYVSTDDIVDFPNSIPFYIDLQNGTGELYSEQIEIKGGLLRSVDAGTDPAVIAINGTAGSSTIKAFCLDNVILSGGKGSGISSTLPDVNWELRGHIVSTATFNGAAVPLFNSAPQKLVDYRDTAVSDYACVWGGSGGNPSIGNGSLVAKAKRIGNIDYVNIIMTAGSTTTFGSGTWSFTAPRIATATATGTLYALDAGTTQKIGVCKIEAGTNLIQMYTDGTTDFGPTYPFTWAENDRLVLSLAVFS